jgi:hypothetical protein
MTNLTKTKSRIMDVNPQKMKVPDRGFGRNFSFVFSSEINDWMGDSAERKKVYQEMYRVRKSGEKTSV